MFDPNNITWLYTFIYELIYHTTLVVLAPITSTSDIYALYLLSALALGVWVASRSPTRTSIFGTAFWKNFQSQYLCKKIWGHPSALLDMRYYFVNGIIFSALCAPLALQSSLVVSTLEGWMGTSWGSIWGAPWTGLLDGAQGAGPLALGVAIKLVYTVVFFVAYDFGRFVAHSALHDVKWLWEFHKIHHSAEVLTPFTAFRVHPLDLIVMLSVPALCTGTVTWLFHTTVSAQITFYTLLNLHLFVCLFNFIDNLRHWNVWLTYPAPLNKWFISPAHHQLHHSAAVEHWGCNRGFELAIWDRLYKTLITPSRDAPSLVFGLGDKQALQWRRISQLYLNPFRSLLFSNSHKAAENSERAKSI